MSEQPANFFSKLKRLGCQVERETQQLKDVVENKRPTYIHARAAKIARDWKKETMELKKNAQLNLERLQEESKRTEEIFQLRQSLLDKYKTYLTEVEEHMKQYGYVTWEEAHRAPVSDEAVEDVTEEEKDSADVPQEIKNEENLPASSPPRQEKPPSRPNRTPQLEDFGISQFTLQRLRKFGQKEKSPPTAKITTVASLRSKMDSVPSPFQHNGLIVTPSLMGGRSLDTPQTSSRLETIENANEMLGMDSPVPPVFRTPGVKQIMSTTKTPHSVADLKMKLYTSDSPVPPVFQTPGVKQITPMTGQKMETKYHTKAPKSQRALWEDEPQAPDMTRSLEALSELTEKFSSLHNMPKAPESLADKLGHSVRNVTPPTPELLSQRLSRMDNGDKYNKHAFGDKTPEPPKLLGRYEFKF